MMNMSDMNIHMNNGMNMMFRNDPILGMNNKMAGMGMNSNMPGLGMNSNMPGMGMNSNMPGLGMNSNMPGMGMNNNICMGMNNNMFIDQMKMNQMMNPMMNSYGGYRINGMMNNKGMMSKHYEIPSPNSICIFLINMIKDVLLYVIQMKKYLV